MKLPRVLIIGIDCATKDGKVGLALADYDAGGVCIKDARLGSVQHPVAATVERWLRERKGPALLAIDAPLGWPKPLSPSLADHAAGQVLDVTPDNLFQRTTDRFVQTQLSKRPLDVGADRIARTAHAALRLLGELSVRLGLAIPLAWRSSFSGVAAIEVYPAATLMARAFRSSGYKKPKHAAERREVIASISREVSLGTYNDLLEGSADALDAAVCVLAAKDFLDNLAMPPLDLQLAKREGWIWTAPSRANGVTKRPQ